MRLRAYEGCKPYPATLWVPWRWDVLQEINLLFKSTSCRRQLDRHRWLASINEAFILKDYTLDFIQVEHELLHVMVGRLQVQRWLPNRPGVQLDISYR